MSGKPIILLFIKAPVKGQVKSRLAAAVGEEAALELYQNFVLDIVDTVEKSGYPFRICFYPPHGEGTVADWLGRRYPYLPQEGDDLGARMESAFSRIFSEGFTSALLIGSDIPDLTLAVIQEAFASLKQNDVVIGPAVDGGYYLIGFNRDSFLPRIFQGLAWGANTVFRETMNRVQEASLRIHRVPQWRDVDTPDDLWDLYERNKHTAFHKSKTMTYLTRRRDRLFS